MARQAPFSATPTESGPEKPRVENEAAVAVVADSGQAGAAGDGVDHRVVAALADGPAVDGLETGRQFAGGDAGAAGAAARLVEAQGGGVAVRRDAQGGEFGLGRRHPGARGPARQGSGMAAHQGAAGFPLASNMVKLRGSTACSPKTAGRGNCRASLAALRSPQTVHRNRRPKNRAAPGNRPVSGWQVWCCRLPDGSACSPRTPRNPPVAGDPAVTLTPPHLLYRCGAAGELPPHGLSRRRTRSRFTRRLGAAGTCCCFVRHSISPAAPDGG